jgi:hypothetical protein
VNVGEPDLDSLVERKIYACNSRQTGFLLALSLLVPRVRADHEHDAAPADDPATLTHRLYGRSYLHRPFLGRIEQQLREKVRKSQELDSQTQTGHLTGEEI